MKEIYTQVQEAHRIQKKLHPKRNTQRHIIITLAKIKDKERILKAARLSADLSKENLQARRG